MGISYISVLQRIKGEWRKKGVSGGLDMIILSGGGEKKRKKNKSDGRNGGQLRRSNDLQDSWSLLNFFFFLGVNVKGKNKRGQEAAG